VEIIDEELVPPAAATAGVGCPWGFPVLAETLYECALDVLWPDFARAVFEELSVLALWCEGL
jgi:hypothetical protein